MHDLTGTDASSAAGHGDDGEARYQRGLDLLQDFLDRDDEDALATAVSLFRLAAADLDARSTHRLCCLTELSRALRNLAALRCDETLLAEAIDAGQAAVTAMAQRPAEERAAARNQLALALWARADETGTDEDRSAMLTQLRSAAAELPADHRLAGRYYGNLGLALRDEYVLAGDGALIEESVAMLRIARAAVGADDPDRSAIESNLALALQDQCERTGEVSLLDEATGLLEIVIEQTEPGDPWRGTLLANLSAMYQDRYEMCTDADALDTAVRLAQAAVDAENDAPRAASLTHLGLALRMSYEHSGAAEDLDRALAASLAAVELAGDDHPRLAIYLSNLGLTLMAAYNRGGDAQVLEDSIARARQATLAEHQGGYRRPGYLSNLALALWTRYAGTGELSTLDEAIAALREAVASAQPGSPDFDRYTANLGLTLWSRCERAYDDDIISEAIRCLTGAAGRTSPEHAERSTYLSNLSEAFHLRYRNRGGPRDLDAAIDLAHEAIGAAPGDHIDAARFTSNLGVLCQARHRQGGDPADIMAAIELFRKAVARTASGHLDEGLYRFNLGDALRQAAASGLGRAADEEAYAQLSAAAAAPLATPSLRAEAGWAAGRLAADAGDFVTAGAQLSAAVDLLQRVAPVHLQLADQAHQLGQFLGLVSDAAACLIRCGRGMDALTVLEAGRGILLEQALRRDSAIAELRERDQGLADRLSWLRDSLDPNLPAGALGSEPADPAQARDRRHALLDEWYRLLAEIRSIPGLERFLLPPLPDALMSAARSSPVVIVNISRYGSDALVAAVGQVRVIPLAAADPPTVAQHVEALRAALSLVLSTDGASRRSAERRFNGQFGETARWLTAAITAPVLDELAREGMAQESVCWSPTGLLALLPLHAACGDEGPVHCYTTTIRATLGPELPGVNSGLPAVVVSMSADLPSAALEAEAVGALLDADILQDGAASVAAVADALQDSAICHLAVHAVSDLDSAARGYLELSDGTLSIADIVRLRPRRPWLAYLSACDTANTGTAIPDQGVTVASAFNLVGYPNVVGTLWPADDKTAAQVAQRFYAELRLAGGVPAVPPATALHMALRSVRRALHDRPLLWAPYLFIGQLRQSAS